MKKDTLSVFKVGGHILENDAYKNAFLNYFANHKGKKILIHGGGPSATALSKKLGIETKMHQGRRITSKEDLEVAIMVYAGLINKKVVAQLQKRGCNSLGLSGADGFSILAQKREIKEIDFGYVGDPEKINAVLIDLLLKNNISPVFCALSCTKEGQILNTNADTIAAHIASAMTKLYCVNLYFVFEEKGVLLNKEDKNSIIKTLTFESLENLVKNEIITMGMLPKIENGFYALRNQVDKVFIGNVHLLPYENGESTQLIL